jgi:hypothetical protein
VRPATWRSRCRIGSGKEKTVKKIVPAVFFQKQLDGAADVVKRPARLDLFDDELRRVVGAKPGQIGGGETFSYSSGWLDVLQPDDCSG